MPSVSDFTPVHIGSQCHQITILQCSPVCHNQNLTNINSDIRLGSDYPHALVASSHARRSVMPSMLPR